MLSGYSSSKHAVALLAGLHALPHVEVIFCANVKTFSLKRILSLIKRYGWRDAFDKFRNVYISSRGNKFEDETKFITEFNLNNNVLFKNVASACAKLHIQFISIASLKEESLVQQTIDRKIDLLIYSGGGILKKKLIEATKTGVLNAHGGPLPFFRGMNGLEWSLLYNVKPEVTIHLIDQGIDTGPILAKFPIEIKEGDTISSLRGKSVVVEVKGILTVVKNFDTYLLQKSIQQPNEGKQFFRMHNSLKQWINEKLKLNWRPSRSQQFEQQER